MSQNITAGALALVDFMAGKQGAKAPKVAKFSELFDMTREASRLVSVMEMGREKIYLGATLAVYARSNGELSITAAVAEVDEAAPVTEDKGSYRRKVMSQVRAAMGNHAERFTPSDRFDDNALIAEALAYAKEVNVRAEADARAEAAKAKRDANKTEKEAVTTGNEPSNPVLVLIETLTRSIEGLKALALEGDEVAQAALDAAYASLAPKEQDKAKAA